MKPHVKLLRKEFQQLQRNGVLNLMDACEKCGKSCSEVKQLELHHKVALKDVEPNSGFNPNTQDNLVTLCNNCHKGYHVSYEDMDMDEWLTDVPLEIVYQKLQAYREKKNQIRLQNIRKHRT